MRKPTKAETKTAITTVTGFCVRSVVAAAVANIVPAETKAQKVKVFVAAYAIAGVVGRHTHEYVSDQFDELSELFSKKNTQETPATEE